MHRMAEKKKTKEKWGTKRNKKKQKNNGSVQLSHIINNVTKCKWFTIPFRQKL